MIKTKTFALQQSTSYNGVAEGAMELDDMINKFIEEKTAEGSSFKIINILYSPTIATNDRGTTHWYPSAMLVYDQE